MIENKQNLLEEQLNYFDNQLKSALISLFLLSSLVVYVFFDHVGIVNSALWLSAVSVSIFFRVYISYSYNMGKNNTDLKKYYILFFLGAVFTSLVWSVGIFLFFVEGSVSHQAILAIIFTGISAGAIIALSVRKEIYFVYVAILLVPLVYKFALEEDPLSVSVAWMTLLYGLFLVFMSIKYHNVVKKSIMMRFENSKLIENLQCAKKSAEQSSKIKSEFLANMSHEIRTPINAVLGMTDLALHEELNEKSRNYIQKSNTAAKSLLGIINDILDFSKMESGRLELSNTHFELTEIIKNTILLINTAAKDKELKTKIMIDKDVPKVYYGDSTRLGQVLTNLASNAVKFSHSNNSVTFKVSLVSQEEEYAVLKFSVEDEGIGISKENQKKLFQSFSQADNSTHRRFGGSGLGLAISKRIVNLMGGEIWVESDEGIGSTFSFTVKLQKSSSDAIMETSEDDKLVMKHAIEKLKGSNVLLVEDNEMNQELAIELLSKDGLYVTVANNGKEALDILETKDFDIVLIDIQMPIMDGYEATYAIRKKERYRDLPIIAMTANVMSDDIQKAQDSGMDDHIGKPIDVFQMFVTLSKYVKKTS